jgi:predicted DNA-binding transcriptional regulator
MLTQDLEILGQASILLQYSSFIFLEDLVAQLRDWSSPIEPDRKVLRTRLNNLCKKGLLRKEIVPNTRIITYYKILKER